MTVVATGCSYAACGRPVVAQVDGWGFCNRHVRLHESEQVGAPPPRSGPKPKYHPHGSAEAYRRHVRRGERPCAECLKARLDLRERMMAQSA